MFYKELILKKNLPELMAVVSDVHVPEQCPHAWPLAKQILTDVQPPQLLLLGDFMNNKAVNRHRKTPQELLEYEEELDSTRAELADLRKRLKKTRIIYVPGNHEDNLEEYLMDHAPALYHVKDFKLPHLLGLDKLDIDHVPYHSTVRMGKLNFFHGDEFKVSYGSKKLAEAFYSRVGDHAFFGHYHRIDRYFAPQYRGGERGSFANGCLQRLDVQFDRFPRWQQGMSFVHFTPNGYYDVDQIRFNRVAADESYRFAMIFGKFYENHELKRKKAA